MRRIYNTTNEYRSINGQNGPNMEVAHQKPTGHGGFLIQISLSKIFVSGALYKSRLERTNLAVQVFSH